MTAHIDPAHLVSMGDEIGRRATMIDLMPFCGTESLRPYLENPFSQGDFTYATDGRILVRVPRREDVAEQDKPNVKKVYDAAGLKPEFMPLRIKFPPLQMGECTQCDGSGYEHDCPDYECECDGCDGTGIGQEKVSVDIRGVIFDARYIRLIQRLPNARFATNPSPSDEPSWFEFDGGDGLLMSMRRPYDEHIAEPQEEPAP